MNEENNNKTPEIRSLTEKEMESMKTTHYQLHLPNTLTKEQLTFIRNMAISIINNEPFVVIKEQALRFLFKLAVQYQNILFEFDEGKRWSVSDENMLETLSDQFQGFIDYLQEQYKLKIMEREE